LLSSTESKRRWILQPISQWLAAATRDLGAVGEVEVEKEGDEKNQWYAVVRGGHAVQGGGERGWRVLREEGGEIVKGEEGSGVLQGL
jgi:hypothetical protein